MFLFELHFVLLIAMQKMVAKGILYTEQHRYIGLVGVEIFDFSKYAVYVY